MPNEPAEHFFPQGDADLVAWGDQFNSYVQANFAALGLSAAEATGWADAGIVPKSRGYFRLETGLYWYRLISLAWTPASEPRSPRRLDWASRKAGSGSAGARDDG